MAVLTDSAGWFTLELPEGWERQDDDGVTILRHPLGVGTVYLAGGRHAGGRQPSFGRADFLSRFLGSLGLTVDAAAIEVSQGHACRVFSYDHETGGVCWRHWSISNDETALLISYTCAVADSGIERDELNEMVHSVRLHPSEVVH